MDIGNGIYFGLSLDRTRMIGRRGGRARARNLRLRQTGKTSAESVVHEDAEAETVRQAIAALDAKFPWLAGAERRRK